MFVCILITLKTLSCLFQAGEINKEGKAQCFDPACYILENFTARFLKICHLSNVNSDTVLEEQLEFKEQMLIALR